MAERTYRIVITPTAEKMLREIGKRYGGKAYRTLRDLIKGLATKPHERGEALRRPLIGLYSLHYARFRIIYHIDDERVIVSVIGAGFHASGERSDIYQVITRLVERGRLEIKPTDQA